MLVIFLEEPPPILSGIATERGTTNRNVYLFIYFFKDFSILYLKNLPVSQDNRREQQKFKLRIDVTWVVRVNR